MEDVLPHIHNISGSLDENNTVQKLSCLKLILTATNFYKKTNTKLTRGKWFLNKKYFLSVSTEMQ